MITLVFNKFFFTFFPFTSALRLYNFTFFLYIKCYFREVLFCIINLSLTHIYIYIYTIITRLITIYLLPVHAYIHSSQFLAFVMFIFSLINYWIVTKATRFSFYPVPIIKQQKHISLNFILLLYFVSTVILTCECTFPKGNSREFWLLPIHKNLRILLYNITKIKYLETRKK